MCRTVCESLFKAFKDVLNKRYKKSPNEAWIIPEAKGSITTRLSPLLIHLIHIFFPYCFSDIRRITGVKVPSLWQYVPDANCFLKYTKLYGVINGRVMLKYIDYLSICIAFLQIYCGKINIQLSINSSLLDLHLEVTYCIFHVEMIFYSAWKNL